MKMKKYNVVLVVFVLGALFACNQKVKETKTETGE